MDKDALLRVVRRRVTDHDDTLTVIGIDDFAFRRVQTYGTIVSDLERRRPVVLLPDRALKTSRAWLSEHPTISVVAQIVVVATARRSLEDCRMQTKSPTAVT